MNIDYVNLMGGREYQDDRILIIDDFIIMVLDGHGGHDENNSIEHAVDIVHRLFPIELMKNIKDIILDDPLAIISIIQMTCIDVDKIMYENFYKKGNCRGGTTMSGIIKIKGKEYIVNVGDSETVVVDGIVPIYVTKRHKPDIYDERCRIFDAGGFVFSKRAFGILSISKVFGDYQLGKIKCNMYNENCALKPIADVTLIEKPYTDIFIYSDGLGDVCNYHKLITFALFYQQEEDKKDEGNICERLGILASKVSNDNISIIHVSILSSKQF